MAGIRRAAVIGINDYADAKVEKLSGAVSDATEMRDILTGQGNFTIDDQHFLTDNKATSENIRRAISDVFWKTDEECDLALFYFSGHGRRDHLGYGYLLAHDADHTAPLVKGIRIQELKELFLCAQPKKTCIMILDCCYSGIATERGAADETEHIKAFRKETELEGTGSGRFIMASADADKTSREAELEHAFGGGKHVHGLFSFHLIEGLRGGPKDEFGRISLGAVVKYIDAAFKDDPKHRPQLNQFAAIGVHDIILTTAAAEFEQRLQKESGKVREWLDYQTPTDVMVGIELLADLRRKRLENEAINELFNHARIRLNDLKLRATTYNWWLRYRTRILKDTGRSVWYELLSRTLPSFELHALCELGDIELSFVSRAVDEIVANKDHWQIVSEIRTLDAGDRKLPQDTRLDESGDMTSGSVIPKSRMPFAPQLTVWADEAVAATEATIEADQIFHGINPQQHA
jgi:uncharacterized caspase-like protein